MLENYHLLYFQLTLPLQYETVLYSRQFIQSKMNQLICSSYIASVDNFRIPKDPYFDVSPPEGLTLHTVCCGVEALPQKGAK